MRQVSPFCQSPPFRHEERAPDTRPLVGVGNRLALAWAVDQRWRFAEGGRCGLWTWEPTRSTDRRTRVRTSNVARVARVARVAGVVLALVATGGCGAEVGNLSSESGTPAQTETSSTVPAAADELTTAFPVTVLDDGEGAELCLGGVADSLPPQCGGPRLLGWNWSDHRGDFEDVSGTRWGSFVVIGTFDGTNMTPTEVVPAAEWDDPGTVRATDRDFTSPCPVPEGGWQPIDPATTTERTKQQAVRTAQALATYGELWVDQSINPAYGDPITGPEGEMSMNDPRLLVLNVRVTDNLAQAEAAIREVWGGALCVSLARFTDRELARIQRAMNDVPGITYSGRGDGRVEVGVTYDDGSLQAQVDREYGEGAVLIDSALRPVT